MYIFSLSFVFLNTRDFTFSFKVINMPFCVFCSGLPENIPHTSFKNNQQRVSGKIKSCFLAKRHDLKKFLYISRQHVVFAFKG